MSAQEPFTIEQFYKFLNSGKLMAGKCLKCGKIHLPPRPICDNCYSTDFKWQEIPARGKLLTYTVIHVAPQQFQNLTPYTIGIIELKGGLKLPGMIQGLKQDQLKVGLKLIVDFSTCSMPQDWPQWPRYCFKMEGEHTT